MKNNWCLYFLLVTFLICGWFYWTQIRTASIRKMCYSETFRLNEDNLEWAEGKYWDISNKGWGWVYPDLLLQERRYSLIKHKENRNASYKQCLIREGISTTL